jgi:hypothetical protein
MKYDLIDKMYVHIKRYEEAINETYNNYHSLKWLGRYDPIAPYINKYELLFMIRHLNEKKVNIAEIEKDYNELNEHLSHLEQDKGKDYRDKLYDELKFEIDIYSRAINTFFELDPICVETGNDLAGRDIIDILLIELKCDYDLVSLEERVSMLDDILKSKFEYYARRGSLGRLLEECPDLEISYYPDSFWWRHPSKILQEMKNKKS